MVHLKSDRELARLRESAELVGRTLAEVARHIRPGVTTRELDAVAEAFIRRHGAVPAFKGYQVGGRVFPATLCVSRNDVVVHGIPDEVPLEEGDLLSVDCGVVLNGYYGDSAYTFAVGAISAERVQLCRVTYEALLKGIAESVAGRRVGDIAYAVQTHCEQYGYGVVRDLVGHGIGRRLHEDPQVPNFGRRGTGRKLKPGMTFCIEPMVNLGTAEVVTEADGWTVRTADGQPSAHYEHMVAVQRGGPPEVLTTFAYIEEVIGTPPYKLNAELIHHG
ncbi:type I methionyl aminopeptidase [Rhodocaloribacter litoris]|uniref:type I methionyl aminopeptidase n=1 Tax=Rhodocaloribacter litoris TaxID=2558931 RepID=UPI0014227F28|nr:type I methionyl aminopeptidase [Rhodocaloribacter litoris]QXD16711.1 type I methionyl aminopeptidase [Rhodocaloribacter litoris]GIV59290.1 MAG: methionine aminopeptidase [Rhodothermaceae bacterium]